MYSGWSRRASCSRWELYRKPAQGSGAATIVQARPPAAERLRSRNPKPPVGTNFSSSCGRHSPSGREHSRMKRQMVRQVLTVLILGSFVTGSLSHGQSSGGPSSLQSRLAQTARQRADNQKLMWDAADGFASKCLDFATSQGEVSSSENFTRIAEVAHELKAQASQQGGMVDLTLVSELGRLLFLEGMTRVNEAAGTISDIFNAFGALPTFPLMLQDYVNFVNASHEDGRLRDVEISLQAQLDNSVLNNTDNSVSNNTDVSPDTQAKPPLPDQPPQAQPRDLSELDDALVLLRFAETKDWSVEDKDNVARIAKEYPDIDNQYRAAIAREVNTDILERARQRQNDLSNAENAARRSNSDLDAQIASAQAIAQTLAAQQAHGIKITIPADWVPCTCPDQHVGAGIIVNGVQYHTPLLHCQ